MKTALFRVFALMFMFFLSGCGEKKCFFVSQNSKQIEIDAPVVWYDAYVGRVASLEQVAGGTKVVISFNKKYNKEIRDGISGRVVNDPSISPKAFVLLVGGKDTSRSLVDNGAQIPESRPSGIVAEGILSFLGWLKNCHSIKLIITGVLFLCLPAIIKFFSTLIKILVFAGIVLAIGYLCFSTKIDWNSYQNTLSNVKESAEEAKDWIQQHGENLKGLLDASLKEE